MLNDDHSQGRVLALLLSFGFLTLQLVAKPFRRYDDNWLMVLSISPSCSCTRQSWQSNLATCRLPIANLTGLAKIRWFTLLLRVFACDGLSPYPVVGTQILFLRPCAKDSASCEAVFAISVHDPPSRVVPSVPQHKAKVASVGWARSGAAFSFRGSDHLGVEVEAWGAQRADVPTEIKSIALGVDAEIASKNVLPRTKCFLQVDLELRIAMGERSVPQPPRSLRHQLVKCDSRRRSSTQLTVEALRSTAASLGGSLVDRSGGRWGVLKQTVVATRRASGTSLEETSGRDR